jgi:hypothetical protein
MITYKSSSKEAIIVLLNGKHAGLIQRKEGFAYFPKNSKTSGEIFKTIEEVKKSLEQD